MLYKIALTRKDLFALTEFLDTMDGVPGAPKDWDKWSTAIHKAACLNPLSEKDVDAIAGALNDSEETNANDGDRAYARKMGRLSKKLLDL